MPFAAFSKWRSVRPDLPRPTGWRLPDHRQPSIINDRGLRLLLTVAVETDLVMLEG